MGFSYNRANNSRREYLEELLTSVYGTTNIKYECKKDYECVSTGNSIFYLCNFNKRRSMGNFCERFKELFEYSLLNDDFEFTPPGGKGATIRTDSILTNIQKYLIKIGVNFSEYSGIEIRREKMRWILYEAMILYLLPAIFFVEYKDKDNENHENDNIHLQILAAVVGIQQIFNRDFPRIHNKQNTTKVYDSSIKKPAFNYKLPIEISSMDPPTLIPWEDISKEFNCNYIESHSPEEQEQQENIIDGFIRVDPIEERTIEIIDTSNYNYFYTVSISSMSYQPKNNLTKNIDYYTYIDDADELKLKAQYKTNSQLKGDIKRKAQEDISKMFKTNEMDYYRSIAKYIEGALNRISKIDMQIFIKKGISISWYQEALGYFTSKADVIVDFYIKEYGEEPCKLMVKNTFIDLISRFSNQLETKREQLTDKYKTLLDDSWRDMHKTAINEYLSSAISLAPSIRKVHPELTTFERLKNIVQKYYDTL